MSAMYRSASGGDSVQFFGGYVIHTFTSVTAQSFIVNSPISGLQVLIVGGGGGGGQTVSPTAQGAGGGGAGGLVYCASLNVPIGTYTVSVGSGGSVGAIGVDVTGGNGGNSSFVGGNFSFTASGGGGGGGHNLNGSTGGSGGGAGGDNVGHTPGATNQTTVFTGGLGYGNTGGGNFIGSPYAGGGGGGAGGVGGASTGSGGGTGGVGLQYSISGTPTYYAGGGGGGSPSGAGGLGGGGAGGTTSGNATPGTNGTGGGGGGTGSYAYSAAVGGSGIVIIAYPAVILSLSKQIASGGDSIQFINGYLVHTFTTVGTLAFTANSPINNYQVLIVAGGGGGARGTGGGGGAGGLVYSAGTTINPGSYAITVGGGGAGGTAASVPGGNGSNSSISGLGIPAAIGGGGGNNTGAAGTGGSGGGVSNYSPGAAGTAGQGNSGGGGLVTGNYEGGGGGGAGAPGADGVAGTPGVGGIGKLYSISGSPAYYAGGGGGGWNGSYSGGAGGLGGGGAGGASPTLAVATSGTPGTGGGGGGGNNYGSINGHSDGGAGGSGIVIIAYPAYQMLFNKSVYLTLSTLYNSLASVTVGLYSLNSLTGPTSNSLNASTGIYPSGYLVANSGSPYGTASSSSNYPGKSAYGAYSSNDWWPSNSVYTANIPQTSGTSTVAQGITFYGEWNQIQFSTAILPNAYQLAPQSATGVSTTPVNTLGTWYILASNDGSTWFLIDTRSNVPFTAWIYGTVNTYTISGLSTAYSYWRIVCNMVTNNTSASIAKLAYLNQYSVFSTNYFTNLNTSGQSIATYNASAGLQYSNALIWYNQSAQQNNAFAYLGNPVIGSGVMYFNNPVNTASSATSSHLVLTPLGVNLTPSSTGVTIIAKVVFLAASSGQNSNERICDFGNGQQNQNIIFSRSGTTNTLTFVIWNGTTTSVTATGGTIVQGATTIIAAKYDPLSATMTILQDGSVVATTLSVSSSSVSDGVRTNCYIGRSNWAADSMFTGYMYGFQFYNAALPNSTITSIMASSYL